MRWSPYLTVTPQQPAGTTSRAAAADLAGAACAAPDGLFTQLHLPSAGTYTVSADLNPAATHGCAA